MKSGCNLKTCKTKIQSDDMGEKPCEEPDSNDKTVHGMLFTFAFNLKILFIAVILKLTGVISYFVMLLCLCAL